MKELKKYLEEMIEIHNYMLKKDAFCGLGQLNSLIKDVIKNHKEFQDIYEGF
jgi:hypothetical protein